MSAYHNVIHEAERTLRQYLSPLMPFFDSASVNEIMINSSKSIFIEEAGEMRKIDVDLDEQLISAAIRAIATINSKDVEPLMNARLAGMRVAAVMPPCAVHGPAMSIRKLARTTQTFSDYLSRGDFDRVEGNPDKTTVDAKERAEREAAAADGGQGLADFFEWMMETRQDVALVGGTSSGKTTIAGAFLNCIPDHHRIITVEDPNELVLRQENVLQLEASYQNGVTMHDLIKMCLRLRPDRIIVGETRGADFFDLLEALNTGHPGAIFTLHANGPVEALTRMEKLLRRAPEMSEVRIGEIRDQIASSISYIVYQARRGFSRGPEAVIALENELDAEGNYRLRHVYNRKIS